MRRKREDFIGQTFGDYTIQRFSHKGKDGKSFFIAKCVCGKEKIVDSQIVRQKATCTCVNGSKNLKGLKSGKLKVFQYVERTTKGKHYWLCKCECGNIVKVRSDALTSGKTKSCGCLQKEHASILNKTHGKSRERVYSIWQGIIQRTKKDSNVKYYSERNISVCERWKTFENFYQDMGEPVSEKHEIDRIDTNGNYEPNNCRWVTRTYNNINQRKRKGCTSKYKGVYYEKSRNKWVARLYKENKKLLFKRFETEIEAAKAYNEMAKIHYGDNALLNGIKEEIDYV